MKGTHTVVVERAKVKYTLTFKRNISFIRGNSGTGKTTLISMIRDYNDRGPESGVTLSCDVPCETLSGRRWERELSIIEDSIVFLDEGNEFIHSKDFAKAVNGSSNYFVLISRRDANELPYSVDEILKLVNTTSKVINGRKSDKRFYSVTKPLYTHTANMLYQDLNVGFDNPDAVIVEDSKSGYQFYGALCKRLGIPCYTATGVANLKRTIHECPEQNILAIGDGAAFGPYIEKVLGQRVYKNVCLFLPESFEWTLLRSGLIPNNDIPKILMDPSSYIESRDYLSWERFFTDVLVKYSADTRYAYKKAKLNEQYLKSQAMDAVGSVLPECLRAE